MSSPDVAPRADVSLLRLIGLTALVMVAFAANSVLNRMALEGGAGPSSFALIRLISGAAILALLVLLRGEGRALRPARAVWPGVATLTLYILGFSFAYQTLPAGIGALILFGGVQITMFAGAVVAREPLPPLRILGAVIAFAGLAWLMGPGAERPDPLGAALMLAAALGWGLFSLIGRKRGAALATMSASFLWSVPLGLAAFALWPDDTDLAGVALAVTSGAVTSGLGYALWYAVLPQLRAATAAVVQLTVPIIAMAGGMVFLAEPLTLRFALSALLVLGGVALSLRAR
ncbi:DMT family transporter [Marinovum sp.]|uniref:DMT family transporter n=1 Tax=Marinovum sp. TaxID=2024839 RepID=UPI002B26FB86|nr:DMT family transporter [Marinovum sp.]